MEQTLEERGEESRVHQAEAMELQTQLQGDKQVRCHSNRGINRGGVSSTPVRGQTLELQTQQKGTKR